MNALPVIVAAAVVLAVIRLRRRGRGNSLRRRVLVGRLRHRSLFGDTGLVAGREIRERLRGRLFRVVTVILFGGWVILNVVRGLATMLGITPRGRRPQGLPAAARPAVAAASREVIQCRVPGCRHVNPAGARFCRHCGHAFPLNAQQGALPRTALS